MRQDAVRSMTALIDEAVADGVRFRARPYELTTALVEPGLFGLVHAPITQLVEDGVTPVERNPFGVAGAR